MAGSSGPSYFDLTRPDCIDRSFTASLLFSTLLMNAHEYEYRRTITIVIVVTIDALFAAAVAAAPSSHERHFGKPVAPMGLVDVGSHSHSHSAEPFR